MKKEDYQRFIKFQNAAMIGIVVLFAILLMLVTYKIASKNEDPTGKTLNPVDTAASVPVNNEQVIRTYNRDEVNIVTFFPDTNKGK